MPWISFKAVRASSSSFTFSSRSPLFSAAFVRFPSSSFNFASRLSHSFSLASNESLRLFFSSSKRAKCLGTAAEYHANTLDTSSNSFAKVCSSALRVCTISSRSSTRLFRPSVASRSFLRSERAAANSAFLSSTDFVRASISLL